VFVKAYCVAYKTLINVEISFNPLTTYMENGTRLHTTEASGVMFPSHPGRPPLDLLGGTPVPHELLKWHTRMLLSTVGGTSGRAGLLGG